MTPFITSRSDVVRMVAALVAMVALVACSEVDSPSTSQPGGDGTGVSTTRPPATAASVSMQLSDMPPGFVPCEYSGDTDFYNAYARSHSSEPDVAESLAETDRKFKEAGATSGYVAYFADSKASCDIIFTPAEQRNFPRGDPTTHPKIVFSIVRQFETETQAEDAWAANLFGQFNLRGDTQLDVLEGDFTGLGDNSISADRKGANPIELHQASWQNRKFLVLAATDNISQEQSEAITGAMNSRIG